MASSHPSIGAKIKRLREDRDLSLRQLGTQSGISFGLIGRWERNEADPSYEQTRKLAKAFNIPTRWLWDPDPLPEVDSFRQPV